MVIIHRDLKLQNIFIDKNEEGLDIVKIGDFGFARKICKDKIATTYAGSPYTMAPEIYYL